MQYAQKTNTAYNNLESKLAALEPVAEAVHEAFLRDSARYYCGVLTMSEMVKRRNHLRDSHLKAVCRIWDGWRWT